MTATQTPLKPDRVYIADRVVCGTERCAGYTAHATGYTLGGTALVPATAADIAEWASYGLGPLACECCGRVAEAEQR